MTIESDDEGKEIRREIATSLCGSSIIDFSYEYDFTQTRGVRLWFDMIRLRTPAGIPITLDGGGICIEDQDPLGERGINLSIRGNAYSPGPEVPIAKIEDVIRRDLVTLFDGAEIISIDGLGFGDDPVYERDGASFYPLKTETITFRNHDGFSFLFRPEGFCRRNPTHRTKVWIALDAYLMVDFEGACAFVSGAFFSEFQKRSIPDQEDR
ncbi:hypothetical protein RJ53_10185 [Methanocalculus chunghsingensis]|uniref:Uncharacterized protein n=1 Tax=Methanocalculus chunghsingensis TaxID=156457 RepID=A0A8J7W7I2_9EURY|nr:hypothetical protein [Methanocalculus chunghsingensis]MBR1369824.1 hypothetical protein [Methanocalculus chunghsingensis]